MCSSRDKRVIDMLETMEASESSQAGIRTSWRKWEECAGQSFLTQLVRSQPGEASTEPAVCEQERTAGGVMAGGCLGHRDHGKREVLILREARRKIHRTAALVIWREEFGFFRGLIHGITWKKKGRKSPRLMSRLFPCAQS